MTSPMTQRKDVNLAQMLRISVSTAMDMQILQMTKRLLLICREFPRETNFYWCSSYFLSTGQLFTSTQHWPTKPESIPHEEHRGNNAASIPLASCPRLCTMHSGIICQIYVLINYFVSLGLFYSCSIFLHLALVPPTPPLFFRREMLRITYKIPI